MNRVSLAVVRKRRYRKILNRVKGFQGRRKSCIRLSLLASRKAKEDAYIGRKLKKRQFKSMWIKVIGIWARQKGLRYSQVIDRLLERFESRKKAYEAIRDHDNNEHREYLNNF